MKKTWLLYASGLLTLLIAISQVILAVLVLVLYMILVASPSPGDVMLHQSVIYVVAIPFVVSGGIGIASGILMILKKRWKLSLVFNLITVVIFVLGILALFPASSLQNYWQIIVIAVGVVPTVFLVLSKRQFTPETPISQ
jgi:hypothetical protein